MARPNKAGLDYFALDCHITENVRLIQAEYGLKGFAIVVKLYQKIFGELGYYCEWDEDSLLLFTAENGLSGDNKNFVSNIVAACIRRDIFSERLFNEFGILTSEDIQRKYLDSTARREKVEMKKEYLLLSVGKNSKNVVINSINVDRNPINVDRNPQSKVKESKVYINNIVEQNSTDNTAYKEIIDYLNQKSGKHFKCTTKSTKQVIHGRLQEGFSVNDFKKVIDIKTSQWKKDAKMSAYLRPETLFAAKHFESYLNENVSGTWTSNADNNKFNNFNQRSYDFAQLEKQALEAQKG